MSSFSAQVGSYMSAPAMSVALDTPLEEVHHRLQYAQVSSLAVTEGQKMVGVITRTDLLRAGQRQAGKRREAELLTFPQQPVSDIMTTDLITVEPGDTIERAAELMLKGRLHRVYVSLQGCLMGVLSTRDIMLVIRDKRLNKPITTFMSSPVFTIRTHEPISLACERLEKARVSGLVVVDGNQPVGVFTQSVALEARHRPREAPVEESMSSAILLLAPITPIFRAAEQAAAMEVRRVLAWDGNQVQGILTGLDFALAASPQGSRR